MEGQVLRGSDDEASDIAAFALALFAGICFTADLVLWHLAIEAVGAGLATVLGNLQVLVVALAAWALILLVGGFYLFVSRGDDNPPSTPGSLGAANATAQNGDTVLVRGGTYPSQRLSGGNTATCPKPRSMWCSGSRTTTPK